MPFSFPLPRSLGSAVSCLLLQNRLAFSFQFTAPACFFVSFLAAFLLQIGVSVRFPACFLQCAQPPPPVSCSPFLSRFCCFISLRLLCPLSPLLQNILHSRLSPLACFLISPLLFSIELYSLHRAQDFCTVSIFVHLAIVSLLPLFYLPFPCSVWHALFLFARFLYRLFKRFSFCFAALFLVPLLITLFQKQTAALQHLPLRLFVSILSLFSLMLYWFWHVYLALPCPNKAQRVFVSLFLSAFLPGCLSSFISACFYKPLFPGIPPKYPRRASLFTHKKTGAFAGFSL